MPSPSKKVDGPQTVKNANAGVLKPGAKDKVKGKPKSKVKKGIATTEGGPLYNS